MERVAARQPAGPHGEELILKGSRLHLFSTYGDVNAVLRDPIGFGSERSRDNILLSAKDGDEHARLRHALQGALSGPVISTLEPTILRRCRGLTALLPTSGRLDLMAEYVAPVCRAAIGVLLSIEPADETSAFVALRSGDEASVERLLRAHIARPSRSAPDVVARLVAAGLDHERELLPHLRMLLQAGHGTMVDLVADVLLDLLSPPGAWSTANTKAADDAMDRVFRARAPLPFVERRARHRCAVGAATVEPGDTVVLALASANRDDAGACRPHLALGAGAHSCLGGPLLRCVTRCAVNELRRAAPNVQVFDDGTVRDKSALVDRGLAHLWVELPNAHEPWEHRAPTASA